MAQKFRVLRLATVLAAAFISGLSPPSFAQTAIKTDASWGRMPTSLAGVHRGAIGANNTPLIVVPGNVFTIPESLGKLAGANLFHSFERFNVGVGDAALFTTTTSELKNVIARVTGGQTSTIQGALSLQAGNMSRPEFFFINPAGVIVRAGAHIDVPAGLHISTADQLRFAKGFVLATGTPSESSLTTAAPQAFGFIGTHAPTAVSIDSHSTAQEQPKIALAPGAALDITAGQVTFDSVDLTIPGAPIRVAAAGGRTADIALDRSESTLLHGQIELSQATLSTTDAGSILLQGGSMSFSGSKIESHHMKSNRAAAGAIVILSSGEVSMAKGAQIASYTEGPGKAGAIRVVAGSLLVDGKGSLTGIISKAQEGSTGDAGAVSVQVTPGQINTGALVIRQHGEVSSSSEGTGDSGTVDIDAQTLTMEGFGVSTRIFTGTGLKSSGSAGHIMVDVTGTLSMRSVAEISSSTFGPGAAGKIDVHAGTLTIDGGTFRTGVFSAAYANSSGRTGTIEIVAPNGVYLNRQGNLNIANYASPIDRAIERGTITVITPLLRLANGSKITAESVGSVAASKVHLMPSAEGTGNMSISGDSSSEISSGTRLPTLSETQNVFLNVLPATAGTGDGGDIDIRASNLILSDVNVLSQAAAGTRGSAGKITLVVAGQLSVLSNTRVLTDTAGKGHAGDVQIHAGTFLIDPSVISSKAAAGSAGQAGNIQVSATDGVTIAEASELSIENNARLLSPSFRPSTITVSAPQISLLGGQITAASSNDVPASNVHLSAADRITLRNAAILTTAVAGNGGTIQIDAGGALLLDHSGITTSVSGRTNGNAGDINVTTPVLVLNTGSIQANTLAPRAKGGNVVLNVDAVVASGTTLMGGDTLLELGPSLSGLNIIQAAAPEGVSGNIHVSGPLLDVAGSMRALGPESVQNGPLARDACRIGATSSFTAVGRGGLRPAASGLIRPDSMQSPAKLLSEYGQKRRIIAYGSSPARSTLQRCNY